MHCIQLENNKIYPFLVGIIFLNSFLNRLPLDSNNSSLRGNFEGETSNNEVGDLPAGRNMYDPGTT